ncbi:hypothetical protein CRE_16220 [Caenorhabditis remanei]|uniref:DUF281 domain-containing protein n=1 Tax=Caenorhabditis remanei TaxID=31234 RepID=E3MSM7_CAERE|nr:hypothetical protein CRE_16220 [Caenorhabditis remanei]
MCVRMIPPEEVSISTTASSLPTDAPGEVTTEGTATSSETDSPSTGVPVTDTPVTDEPVTEDPTDECTECDIGAIMRDSIPDVQFEFQDTTEAGQCITNKVTCKRTDTMTCTDNKMLATTATGQVSITDSTTTTEVSATLTCANDGTVSWGTITGISKLSCQFEGCESAPACQTCNINDIAPTNPLPGTSFVSSVLTINGCRATNIRCQRDDGLTCSSVAIQGITAGGTTSLQTTENSDVSILTMGCNENGQLTYERNVGITELSCVFNQCPPPSCTSCDIRTIPLTAPPGGASLNTDEATFDGCKASIVTCQRDDGQVCTSVTVQGTTSTGVSDIGSTMGAGLASAELTCSADGKYTTGTGSEVTALSCNFNQCPPPPCTSCIADGVIFLDPPTADYEYIYNEFNVAGECIEAEITSQTTDGKVCEEIRLLLDSSSGTAEYIGSALSTSYGILPISCGGDGTYTVFSRTQVTKIVFMFVNCA